LEKNFFIQKFIFEEIPEKLLGLFIKLQFPFFKGAAVRAVNNL